MKRPRRRKARRLLSPSSMPSPSKAAVHLTDDDHEGGSGAGEGDV